MRIVRLKDPWNDSEALACQVCSEPLNRFEQPDGIGVVVHARIWQTYDHEPVPVPIGNVHPDFCCDYCSVGTATWFHYGKDVTAKNEGAQVEFPGRWAACDRCDSYIKRGKVEALGLAVLDSPAMIRDSRGLLLSPEDLDWFTQRRIDLWRAYSATITRRAPIPPPPPPPAPLRIQNLPKIRDRLVKLWRNVDHIYGAIVEGKSTPLHVPGFAAAVEDPDVFVRQYVPGADLPRPHLQRLTEHVASGLEVADLFYVSRDFTYLALSSAAELPDLTVRREELPAKFGFLVWEDPIGEIPWTDGMAAKLRVISWTLVPNGVWFNLYIQPEDGVDLAPAEREALRQDAGWLVPFNTGIGVPFDVIAGSKVDDEAGRVARTILATFFLMQQPGVATSTEQHAERSVQKAYARQNRPAPTVSIVDLRKHTRPANEHDEPEERRKISVRFMVRGHWKRQAYGAGRSLRRTIYVAPFMKGPDNAPLKTHPTVVRRLR